MCWSDNQFDVTNLTPQCYTITFINLACGLLSDILFPNYLYLHSKLFRNTFIFIDWSPTLPNFKLSTNTFYLYHWSVSPPFPAQGAALQKDSRTLTKYSNIQSEKIVFLNVHFFENFPDERNAF